LKIHTSNGHLLAGLILFVPSAVLTEILNKIIIFRINVYVFVGTNKNNKTQNLGQKNRVKYEKNIHHCKYTTTKKHNTDL